MITPMSISLTQLPRALAGGTGNTRVAPMIDLQTQAVSAPGYSNGNHAYLDTFWSNGNVTPGILPNCNQDPTQLVSYSASPNYGFPSLKVQFTAITECGTGASLTWIYGDENQSTQAFYNSTTGYDRTYIYDHTYTYVGSFIAKVSINAGAGLIINASTPIYASFTPSLFYSFYNESGLIAKGVNGSTYSIGLVEECDKYVSNENTVYQNELKAFDSEFDLPSTNLNFFLSGGTNCTSIDTVSSPQEASLDIEWAHVAAPGAKIYVCLDTLNSFAGLQGCVTDFYQNRNSSRYDTMIGAMTAGICAEGDNDLGQCTNGTDPYGTTWSTAESAGMNLFSSSGDFSPDDVCALAYYPASNPYGIAVGGTTVVGVGASGTYGTEKVWERSYTTPQCQYRNGQGKLVSYPGSPGETFGNNSYYPAPSWQQSALNVTHRYFPDVSMIADNRTGVPVDFNGTWFIAGGTSVGAPIWAGILDVLFQAGALRLGVFAASFLYNHMSCFHEIANPFGKQDGLGTPKIGCLSSA